MSRKIKNEKMKTLESLNLKHMGVIGKSKLSKVLGGAPTCTPGSEKRYGDDCDGITMSYTSDDQEDGNVVAYYGSKCDSDC
jgi:hypothetical protein